MFRATYKAGQRILACTYLVVAKDLLQLFLGNAHPDTVGAVHHKYNGVDITAKISMKEAKR